MASQDTPPRRNPARIIDKPETPKNVANKSSHTVVSTAYPQYVVDIGEEVARSGQHVNLNPAKLKKGIRVWGKFCSNSNSKTQTVYPATVNYVEFNFDGTIRSVHLLWYYQDTRYTNRNPDQVFFRDLLLEGEKPQSPVPVLPVTPTASNSQPVSSAPRETGNAKHKKKRRLSTPPKSELSSDSVDCIIVEKNTETVAESSARTGLGGSFQRVAQAQQKLSADEESAALRAGKAPATHIDSSEPALPDVYKPFVVGIVVGDEARRIHAAFLREEENTKRNAKTSLEGSSSSSVSRALGSAFNMTDSDGAAVGSSHRPPPPPDDSDGAAVGSSHRPPPPSDDYEAAAVGSSHRPPPPSDDYEGAAVGSSHRPQKLRRSAAESPRPPPPPDDFRAVSPTATHDDPALPAPVPETDITASGRFVTKIERYKCSAVFAEKPSAYVGMSSHIPKKPVKKRGGGAKRL